MSGTISITDGVDTVDLTTGHNCEVKTMLNNPFFTMSLPKTVEFKDGSADSNVIVINLNMMTHRFNLNFDLLDGIGSSSDYYKLVNMFGTGKSVSFTYNDRTYNPCFIEQMDLVTQPGRLDMLQGCTLTLIWASALSSGIGNFT